MSESPDRSSEHGISTGNVQGIGIVVGHHSSASVGPSLSATQQQLAMLLKEFTELLAHHAGDVPDAADVRESVQVAIRETEGPSPRWRFVRTLLKGIQASVAGASTLAAAITNMQTILDHLPR